MGKFGFEKQLSVPELKKTHSMLYGAWTPIIREKHRLLGQHARLATQLQAYHTALPCWQMGIGPPLNVPFNNSLANGVYLTLSCLELLKAGYYGSTRILLRQFLEMNLIGKAALYSPEVEKRWPVQEEDSWKAQNKIGLDVFRRFGIQRFTRLRALWHELSLATHHTPFAQQPFLLLHKDRMDTLAAFNDALGNVEHCTDVTFLMQRMHRHLLSNLVTRTASFRRTYVDRADLRREQRIRRRMDIIAARYWQLNDVRNPVLNPPLRKALREFQSNWKKPLVNLGPESTH